MRFRPAKNQPHSIRRTRLSAAPKPVSPAAPPQMDNPYSRHYTQPRTLESLFPKKR